MKVEYHGALRNIMHEGDISAKADLFDLRDNNHLYALGAIENLKGEIQIFDSKPYNSSVIDGKLLFDSSFLKKATLLVYASVDAWTEIGIPDDVKTYEALEKFLERKARENGINIDEPFPFLLQGTVRSCDWHVIDWEEGDMEHNHEKHKSSGLNGEINDRQVEMLGFYSNYHHAVFTHHSTNMHIHLKTADNKIAGHVDDLILGNEMLLKLPKN
jgi:acetolactate decarboxylase